MPTVRFIREEKDVKCKSGENLREISLREGIELYGLKGKLGNCGGYGQCITCFVSVEGEKDNALSPLTEVEKTKLRGRPANWRLSCQCLVTSSVAILTKPQAPPSNSKTLIKTALESKIPD